MDGELLIKRAFCLVMVPVLLVLSVFIPPIFHDIIQSLLATIADINSAGAATVALLATLGSLILWFVELYAIFRFVGSGGFGLLDD